MQTQTKRTLIAVVVLLFLAGGVAWWQSGFSLEFTRFFAAEVTPTPFVPGPTITPGPPLSFTLPTPPPGAVRCGFTSRTFIVGVPVPFLGTGGNGPYEWFAADRGAPKSAGTGANFSFTFSTTGTKQVLVQATRAVGITDVGVCTVVIER